MSWEDDGTHANGADGTCQTCGESTDGEWHLLCRGCYAEEQGWTRPARPEPGEQPRSFVVALTDVRRELDQLRRRIERLEGAA